MQVKMLVRGDVVERETCRSEGLELSSHFRPHLSLHMRQEEHLGAETRHVRPKSAARIDEIGQVSRRQDRRSVDQRQMQSDRKLRQTPGHLDGPGRRWSADHQARRCQYPVNVSALDGLVDCVGEAEVVGRDDQIFQCAVSCRSRRNRKNSTPSRRRRFITSGLRIISPIIEAILPGRK
jgi:hypothetical protein